MTFSGAVVDQDFRFPVIVSRQKIGNSLYVCASKGRQSLTTRVDPDISEKELGEIEKGLRLLFNNMMDVWSGN